MSVFLGLGEKVREQDRVLWSTLVIVSGDGYVMG